MSLHNIAVSLIHQFQYLRPSFDKTIKTCLVSDDSMMPSFKAGQRVPVDRFSAAQHGDIVAIASDDKVEIREIVVHKGQYILVAHNNKYPRISLEDYRSLNPGAYFVGVIHE